MIKRQLANTDIWISVLGLGTVKIGRNQGVKYPQHFQLPSDAQVLDLLNLAKELGINLIDTAPAYGESEARLGKLLKNLRQDFIICTKAGEHFQNGQSFFDFSAKGLTQSVEQSLSLLNTDYLDILLIHSNGDDEKIINEHEVFLTLQQLKTRGMIRTFGMSTKTVNGGLLALKEADLLMVSLNPNYLDELPVIDAAETLGKGILIKKALASGYVQQLNVSVEEAIQFSVNTKGVTSVILGTIDPFHLRANVGALNN